MTCRTKRNRESKHVAKIARRLESRIASSKVIQIPDMRNVVHNPSILVRDDRWECHRKGNHFTQRYFQTQRAANFN